MLDSLILAEEANLNYLRECLEKDRQSILLLLEALELPAESENTQPASLIDQIDQTSITLKKLTQLQTALKTDIENHQRENAQLWENLINTADLNESECVEIRQRLSDLCCGPIPITHKSKKELESLRNELLQLTKSFEKTKSQVVEELNSIFTSLALSDSQDLMVAASADVELREDLEMFAQDLKLVKHSELVPLKELIAVNRKWRRRLIARLDSLAETLRKVAAAESILNLNPSNFPHSPAWSNILAVRKHAAGTAELEREKFEEIKCQLVSKLDEICAVLEYDSASLKQTFSSMAFSDVIDILRVKIAELEPAFLQAKKIKEVFQERKDLVQAMINFESSASDPARLFRSSFRLLQEEKFRKSAYPTLLKLESRIRLLVADHIKQGQLLFIKGFDDIPGCVRFSALLNSMEVEIADRYVNETVFGFVQKKEAPPADVLERRLEAATVSTPSKSKRPAPLVSSKMISNKRS